LRVCAATPFPQSPPGLRNFSSSSAECARAHAFEDDEQRAGGRLRGGRHLVAPNQTPLADVMLSVLHVLGLEELKVFGDNEGVFSLT